MQLIVDFPPEILSQIFGSEYTSYLVIRVWLCGSTSLNKKLSNGLSYLRLSLHRSATCKFPRLVSEFHNLRHFAMFSRSNLVSDPSDWARTIKSLPKTLVSLSLKSPSCHDCLTDFESNGAHMTTSAQSKLPTSIEDDLPVLDLARFLPCLQTLTISEDFKIPSHRLVKLPTTLTELTAAIRLIYNNEDKSLCRPLSQLPRGLLRLDGFLDWATYDHSRKTIPEAIELLCADLRNAPPHLQSFPSNGLPSVVLNSDFHFPESLTALVLPRQPAFSWNPSIARLMPSNLRILRTKVDHPHTFDGNWVSILPRTLTKLFLGPSTLPIDFTPFSGSLPPNLTELSLSAYCDRDVVSPLGDWSCIETSEVENGKHWPKSLTSLKLIRSTIKSSDIARMPRTLLKLVVDIASPTSDNDESIEAEMKHFPPHLTDLTLDWSGPPTLQLSKLHYLTMLKHCRLSGTIVHNDNPENDSSSIILGNSNVLGVTPILPPPNLQYLETLKIPTWHCDWFKHLPRGLKLFDVQSLPGLVESPLLASHDVFKDLPITLTGLDLRDLTQSARKVTLKIPPQRLDHLRSLTSVTISMATVSSAMLRMLPESLIGIRLLIDDWNETDLLHLPPRLENLIVNDLDNAPMAKIFEYAPLAVLNGLTILRIEPRLEGREIALQRIELAAKHS